jgi:hypothetical protein
MSLKQINLENGLVLVHDSEKGVICYSNPQKGDMGFKFEFYNQQFQSACFCSGCFNKLGINLEYLSFILNDYLFKSVGLSFILYISDSVVCRQLRYRLTGTVKVEEFYGHF